MPSRGPAPAEPALASDTGSFIRAYLQETIMIAQRLDLEEIERAVDLLATLRQGTGRLFVLGVGGSAANASHATNDFRKVAGIEAYCPTDNVAELTAWTNDHGWESTFAGWLHTSRLRAADLLLVLSVGGGSPAASPNLEPALHLARRAGARSIAIVSRNGGAARELADVCLLVPVVSPERVTPHAEAWQAVLWHLLVHALLARAARPA